LSATAGSPTALHHLRVCICTETYHPILGGGETQARRLAEGLAEHGVQTIILTRRVSAEHPATEGDVNIQVVRLRPIGRQHWKKWGLLLSGLWALFQYKDRYDLILVSGYRVLGIVAVVAGRLLNRPVFLKADSTGEFSGAFFTGGLQRFGLHSDAWLVKVFLKTRNWFLMKADGFIAISSTIREELEQTGELPPKKIVTIPNSVDARLFCPIEEPAREMLREQLGMPSDRVIAVYAGRLVTYKGLPFLIRIWGRVIEKHPQICLYLVGSGSLDIHNCESELRTSVKANNLDAHVRFTGEVSDVHRYLQAADFFVFPTEDEAFGIALIEAMACGLPAIATPVGGIRDIITDGINGLLVPPGDETGWLTAIDRLTTGKDFAERLQQSALHTVRERYTISHVTEAYLDLFNNLIRFEHSENIYGTHH
jgi:glycosyltransferase involved in cell wall biosynthesis